MKLVGVAKGGREELLLVELNNGEFWRIEGDFIVTYTPGSAPSRATRIPSHIKDIIQVIHFEEEATDAQQPVG